MKKCIITFVTLSAIAQFSFASGQEGFGPNQKIGNGVASVTVPDFDQARQQCEEGSSDASMQAMRQAARAAKKDCKRFGLPPAKQAEIIRLIAQDRQDGIPSFDCVAVATARCE